MTMGAADHLFRRLDPEVWIVTSAHNGRRGGLVVTNLMPASIVPETPRVLVGIAKQHATWELIRGSKVFAAHLLSRDQISLVKCFGLKSSREFNKFAGQGVESGAAGLPLLKEVAGWIVCEVEAEWDSGDRSIFLAKVIDAVAPADDVAILTMSVLLEGASEEMLAEMKRQRIEDSHCDAEAIAKWRIALNL